MTPWIQDKIRSKYDEHDIPNYEDTFDLYFTEVVTQSVQINDMDPELITTDYEMENLEEENTKVTLKFTCKDGLQGFARVRLTVRSDTELCLKQTFDVTKACGIGNNWSSISFSEMSYWGKETQLFEQGGSLLYFTNIWDE